MCTCIYVYKTRENAAANSRDKADRTTSLGSRWCASCPRDRTIASQWKARTWNTWQVHLYTTIETLETQQARFLVAPVPANALDDVRDRFLSSTATRKRGPSRRPTKRHQENARAKIRPELNAARTENQRVPSNNHI